MNYNQISKFLDIDAPTTVTGGGESIAALMARGGVVNNGAEHIAQPVNITTENKDEKPITSTENVPAATATSNSSDAPVKSDTPSQPAEPTVAPTPQIAAEPPKAPTLQEVLKNQQPDTVLKELGYDDNLVKFLSTVKELDPKVLNFLNTWKDKGDVTGYLREWTTDYSKMSAEDVMRHQLQKDYPTASQQQLDALFKREVVKAYSLDSDDADEAAEGKLLLEARADRSRTGLIQDQQKYLFPAAPEPKAIQPDNSAEIAKQEFEAYKHKVTESPYVKNIIANNKISFGEGEEQFNYPVKSEDLLGVLFEQEKWTDGLFEQEVLSNGQIKVHYDKPDIEKQMLLAGVHKYGKNFLTEFAKHYKSLGGKSAIDPIENASRPDGSNPAPSEAAPKTPAEAMARQGRLVN